MVDFSQVRISVAETLTGLVLACLLISASIVPTRAADAGPSESQAISYDVSFHMAGGTDEALLVALKAASTAERLSGELPSSQAALRRRAESDVERFTKVLHSKGFYDGTAAYRVTTQESGLRKLLFTIDPGAIYLIEEVSIKRPDVDEPAPMSDDALKEIGLMIGAPADADAVITAERKIELMAQKDGFPFADVTGRRTTIDPERKTMRVTYHFDKGRHASFGAIKVAGNRKVDPGFIARHASWKDGEPYDIGKLDQLRSELVTEGLFSAVDVKPIVPVHDGVVDIAVNVTERPERSIGFGGGYSTSEGPKVQAFWEHRNFFGEGERLRLNATASNIEYGVDGSFRKPLFRDRRQTLIAEGDIKGFNTDAFEETRTTALIGVERGFLENWTATAAVTADLTDITQSTTFEDGKTYLLGLRGGVRRDSTDDPLDPSRGGRFEVSASPYQGFGNRDVRFVTTAMTATRYLTIDDAKRFILAGRAKAGAGFGEKLYELPPDKRFYSGGGGSVRGYSYQSIGTLDANGDPVGGRSILELGMELRARLTDEFGVVPFIEGGNVFDTSVPDIANPGLRWAGGLGFRYYTGVGPVRADFAFPLNRRSGVDDPFQFYISFGQAF